MSHFGSSVNKYTQADENVNVLPSSRKRQNHDDYEAGFQTMLTAKKTQIQPFTSINQTQSASKEEKPVPETIDIRQKDDTYYEGLENKLNDLVNVVTNLTNMVEEMHSHMVKGEDAISQVIQELLEQKDRENKLSEAARELFAVNDQLTQENESYKKEITELRNILKEYEILDQCLKQE
ncbi:uncharacterized protein [Blastocystis hominis]|uniref:Uncharacterized protein n=1 Tax=Blastocystis hominis TaxID=12968 RepID=D8MAI3_BLAHO|nr:uncharacterized protein [Blastocystis hominis]CBK25072.2 unnamed protein product [Blastocystis hominis]|eukprot:XP_012899120.1 uncharacterized protein [Blastocystis hominis]